MHGLTCYKLTDLQNFLAARNSTKFTLKDSYNTVHNILGMLLHYLGKLEVQICCVSNSVACNIESQRSYCQLILMFSMFKTAEVLPAN